MAESGLNRLREGTTPARFAQGAPSSDGPSADCFDPCRRWLGRWRRWSARPLPAVQPTIASAARLHTLVGVEYAHYAVWTLTILLILVGLAGSVLPLLPGTTLIFAAVVLHKLLLPHTLGTVAVVWIGVFWFFSIVSDFVCTLVGARLLGGSKWGMTGAGGGAFVGMFFSLPAILLGTLLGAVAAEKLLGKRADRDALKSGLGAALGFLASTVVRVMFSLAMVTLFTYAVLTAAPAVAPVP